MSAAMSATGAGAGHHGAVSTTDRATGEATPELPVDAGYTIDQLEDLTGVPTRTIRFYRASGLIDAPRRIGRHAFYGAEQLGRLRFIAALRARGMGLDAVARLVADPVGENESFALLLSIQDELLEPWVEDHSGVINGSEVLRLMGTDETEALAGLESVGVIARRPDTDDLYDVPSLAVLELAAELLAAGIAPEVSMAAWDTMRRRIGELADELVTIFAEHPDHGFADNDTPAEISEAFRQLRPVALRAVQLAFAHEIQRSLEAYLALATDANAVVPRRDRASASNDASEPAERDV
jgi:DNA-binding transcriptional MerR regulator